MSIKRFSTRSVLVGCLLVASTGLAFLAGHAVAGGIPGSGALSYGGILEDVKGAALTGSHNIEVKLWSALSGGTDPLCTTSSQTVMLLGGRFSMTLPDDCTTKLKANSEAAVEVLVDGASLGRAKLGAVPYALEAAHAVTADSATMAASAATAASADTAGGALATTITGLKTAVDNPNASKVILNGTAAQTADFAITGGGSIGGKLGVGTTSPLAPLDVSQAATFDPAGLGADHAVLGHVLSPGTGWDANGFCAKGGIGEAMCMGVNSGTTYWGHQESTGIASRMQLSGTTGDLFISGALTQASSQALKKDITYLDAEGMDRALAYVNDTPVATYRYKTMSESTKLIYGVIAEKTPAALLAQDGKGVNVSTTVGVLLASIKAQQNQISRLEARLKKLERRP